jgi:hypothetical protein
MELTSNADFCSRQKSLKWGISHKRLLKELSKGTGLNSAWLECSAVDFVAPMITVIWSQPAVAEKA